jgi:hypothetical protein
LQTYAEIASCQSLSLNELAACHSNCSGQWLHGHGRRISNTPWYTNFHHPSSPIQTRLPGTAYVFKDMFEEYAYHPEPQASQATQQPTQSQNAAETTAFEIPLNTLIECLNIFGTAGSAGTTKTKKWRKGGEDDLPDVGDEDRTGPIDRFFGSEKGTALRMSYAGSGYPLTLFM